MKYLIAIISTLTFAVAITIVAPLLAQEKAPDPHAHEGADEHGHDEKSTDGHEHAHEEGEIKDPHAHEGEREAGAAGHDHGTDTHGHADEKKAPDDHAEHGHGDEEEAEGGGNIGPNKGILEATEEKGFSLSAEARKNFEITTQLLNGQGPWAVPIAARVLSAEEVNLFRVRGGFFKRIDFSARPASSNQLLVSSPDLKPGDEVVLTGVGFLRIAELAAFGGVADGHSH